MDQQQDVDGFEFSTCPHAIKPGKMLVDVKFKGNLIATLTANIVAGTPVLNVVSAYMGDALIERTSEDLFAKLLPGVLPRAVSILLDPSALTQGAAK